MQRWIYFFLMCTNAQPIYKHSLRHLPEKIRQEQIDQTVQMRFHQIEGQILQDASNGKNQTTFTLFCLEPNEVHESKFTKGMQILLYYPYGNTYLRSKDLIIGWNKQPEWIHPKPRCTLKDAYGLYQDINQ